MKKDISPDLIRKYLNGQCTPQETVAVDEWYNSFDGDPDAVSMLSAKQQDELKATLIKKISANVKLLGQPELTLQREIFPLRKMIYYMSGIAAILLIVLLFTVFNQKTSHQNIVSDTAEQLSVTNLSKSIKKQILSDGSTVWLSPQSNIKYPKLFTGAQREVRMVGEAFFEVHKDHKHPFIIYSGGLVTRVWGTSFRIRAYKNIPTEVSVVTGKVSVHIPKQNSVGVMLFPNQKVTYLKDKDALKTDTRVKDVSMQIWQKTRLSFDNIPLNEVMKILNQKFDVSISTEDQHLSHFVLNADFTDLNLPAILEMLEKSLEITYQFDDKGIVLKSKNQL
ncbi:MAG: FecR family protein [Mucilaginibacter sp.]|uniref:FecR family protein n=1 Tax=Mucilaginibacter sp. TaxID=1882438 RepID=UPI003263E6E5